MVLRRIERLMYILSDEVLRAELVPLPRLPCPAIPCHTLPYPAIPYHVHTLPYPAMAQLPEASANGARLTCYHHEIDYGEAPEMHID